MSPTAVVALSRRGADLARTLVASLEDGPDLYLARRFLAPADDAQAFDLPLRPVLGQILNEYQSVVLFLPVGAAVRLIAPYLHDKHQDPAIVSVDDAGRFAVSLVSGHVGGADRLAAQVARVLGATPVITSASHVTETFAVDLLGYEFGWKVDADPIALTRASAAVINGDPVGIYQKAGERDWWPENSALPENMTIFTSYEDLVASPCTTALLVTDEENPATGNQESVRRSLAGKHVVLYRPTTLVAGMGCRRGVPEAELDQLLQDTFREHNLSVISLGCIATADLKSDEPGLIALAEKYDVPLVCYSGDELNAVFSASADAEDSAVPGTGDSVPTPSEKAHSLLGIWGVSEPAAVLASGSKSLLVPRQKTALATIAIARKNYQTG